MRPAYPLLFLTALIVTALSCNDRPPAAPSVNTFDSVIKKYVSSIDTAGLSATEYNYLLFKKYLDRDTAWFINLTREIVYDDSIRKERREKIYCVRDTPLTGMHVQEAYRFYFSESFNPYNVIITIYTSGNSAKLRFVQYGSTIVDSVKRTINRLDTCIVWKSFEKELTTTQWDSLIYKINYADYWGMQQFHEQEVILDGSFWTIEGITKWTTGTKRHRVYRHSPSNTAFKAIGIYMAHLSGQKISTDY